MQFVIFIGFTGLVCSFLYRIPQIWKCYKTKSVKDISVWMIHIQNVSYVFYVIYGFMISDIVYIVSSFVSIIQNIIILLMCCCFRKQAIESIKIEQSLAIKSVLPLV